MVCFHIVEEAQAKCNRYRDTRQAWTKLSGKFDPTTGASKTKICDKFANWKLDDVTKKPEEWITELKLLRGDLRKLDIHTDD